eukprot:7928494-Pyramimonas_sp.AAC.1
MGVAVVAVVIDVRSNLCNRGNALLTTAPANNLLILRFLVFVVVVLHFIIIIIIFHLLLPPPPSPPPRRKLFCLDRYPSIHLFTSNCNVASIPAMETTAPSTAPTA